MLVLAEPAHTIVRERWARAEQLGLSRDADAVPVTTTDSDLVDRRARLEDAFREQRELLDLALSELAAGPRVALVADRDGVILFSRSERGEIDPITRVRLTDGARWGEGTRGTNAIGTAAAEGRAVAVVGHAHYERRNRELFCYATPVRDAYGDVVAVLDVSGPLRTHDPAVGLAVQSAGLVLERALRHRAHVDGRSGAFAAIERLMHRSSAPELLIEATGRVSAINAAARRALLDDGTVELRCERVFGTSFAELLSMATQAGPRVETRSGIWRLSFDPICAEAGRTLALLVHFEPDRTQAARPAGPAPTRPAVADSAAFESILGQDSELRRAKESAGRFAVTELPVLLLAETGTGKELFARAIHRASERASKPFVAVNCGALSPSLIASELFGYAPGAFTGAARGGSDGRIAAADGGTLFLDEIAEMPDSLQAALLRVLDDGVYQRVGESKDRRAGFRLVCATCRDLPTLVAEGRFRTDLYYRIHGACVTIPPLRERADVVWLARRFAEQVLPCGGLSDGAATAIATHDWPGNVRELKSAIAHAAALCTPATTIEREHLPAPALRPARRTETPRTRSEILQAAIDHELLVCDGNVSEAARRLGVGRGTVYRAMKAKSSR